jgi:hypothetical protein
VNELSSDEDDYVPTISKPKSPQLPYPSHVSALALMLYSFFLADADEDIFESCSIVSLPIIKAILNEDYLIYEQTRSFVLGIVNAYAILPDQAMFLVQADVFTFLRSHLKRNLRFVHRKSVEMSTNLLLCRASERHFQQATIFCSIIINNVAIHTNVLKYMLEGNMSKKKVSEGNSSLLILILEIIQQGVPKASVNIMNFFYYTVMNIDLNKCETILFLIVCHIIYFSLYISYSYSHILFMYS